MQTDNIYFVNEFLIKKPVERLLCYTIECSLPDEYKSRKIGYKIASILSRELSRKLKKPVASLGEKLITSPEVKLPSEEKILVKIKGIPIEVEVKEIREWKLIEKEDENFSEAVKRYLNRVIDLIMENEGYRQDGRRFYEKRRQSVRRRIYISRGVFITSKVNKEKQTIIVDPVTEVRSKLNLLEALKLVLKEKNIKNWREAKNSQRK